MSDTPDHIVEVMARAYYDERRRQFVRDGDKGLWPGAWGEDERLCGVLRELAKAVLQALQDEGYIVAKPFWPPEELNGASRIG